MKKILALFLAIFIVFAFSCSSFAYVEKDKCNFPMYYFEDASKTTLFNALDDLSQKEKWEVVKYYPQLGFLSFNYKVKKEVELVRVDLKQYANDVYMFINISKNNTDLEKLIYSTLKPLAKKSNLMKDDYLCKEFRKDVASLEKNRKTVLKETAKSKDVYNIGLHRYIGYDRKVYFKDRLKSLKFKKKNEYNVKDEAKRTKAATKKKREETIQMQREWLKEQRKIKEQKIQMQKEWLKQQKELKKQNKKEFAEIEYL